MPAVTRSSQCKLLLGMRQAALFRAILRRRLLCPIRGSGKIWESQLAADLLQRVRGCNEV